MINEDTPIGFDLKPEQELADLGPVERRKLHAILSMWESRVGILNLSPELDTNPTWAEFDRPRGALTKKDREYINKPYGYEGQPARDIRYRLRQRLKNLYHDAYYLERVPTQDLETVFEDIGPASPHLALIFLIFGLKSVRVAVGRETKFESGLYEKCIEHGIQSVEAQIHNKPDPTVPPDESGPDFPITRTSVSADITVEREEYNPEGLKEQILSGEATQDQFEEYWNRAGRRRDELISEAKDRNLSEIEVVDSAGLTATYDIEELEEDIDHDDSSPTVETYLNAIRRRQKAEKMSSDDED